MQCVTCSGCTTTNTNLYVPMVHVNHVYRRKLFLYLEIFCTKMEMRGGFGFESFRNLENITFKKMTVTNTGGNPNGITRGNGCGIQMSNASVELVDVALKGCRGFALSVTTSTLETTVVATRCEFANSHCGARIEGSLTSAKFNNCVFHDNEVDGIQGFTRSTIHLHGEATSNTF